MDVEEFITDQEIRVITSDQDRIIFKLGDSENYFYALWLEVIPQGKKNQIIYGVYKDRT